MDDLEEKIKEGIKLIKEDNYRKAFEVFSLLHYQNPKNQQIIETCQFLFSRITEGYYDFEPILPEEYIFRGVAKFYKGELLPSIADFDQALKLNQKLDYAHKCKAFSLSYLTKYKEAIIELKKAVQINDHGEYYDDIAENYSKLGDFKSAIEYHEKAIQTSPLDPRLWYNYGTHLGKVTEIDSAIQKFEKAIELNPNYEDAKYNLQYYQKLKKKLSDF